MRFDRYYDFHELLEFMSATHRAPQLAALIRDHKEIFEKAAGSTHNHQAWEGGYLDHVTETINIARWLYITSPRPLPFALEDAIEVLFLHDLEKPFKENPDVVTMVGSYGEFFRKAYEDYDSSLTLKDRALRSSMSPAYRGISHKEIRRKFRQALIEAYGITLTEEQQNALRYVEGVPDSEYTPGERTMNEMATFCHCADLLSARLWWSNGQEQRW